MSNTDRSKAQPYRSMTEEDVFDLIRQAVDAAPPIPTAARRTVAAFHRGVYLAKRAETVRIGPNIRQEAA